MKKIQLTYDPYRMETTLEIGGITLTNKNGPTSTSSDDYAKINNYLRNKTPLQTWIEPLLYDNWKGFVSEVFGDERNDECTIEFNGREIDYDDFCRSLNSQNEKRDKTKRIMFTFNHNKVLNDTVMADNIENVVKQLNEAWFKTLVEKRESDELKNNYYNMNKAYGDALSNEFIIVFAGMYSSGKSTLLNVLIRHDVLPMSTETCTSVNCHIVHDSKMADGIAMYGYAGGKSLFGKRVFRDDDKCRAEFQRLCPMDGTPPYPELDKMELHVNLSHLYPASIDPKTFRLVLIDTPGINSAKSEEDGVNHHSDIAIEAITMKNKPMIIFCVDKNNKEDNHVGEFMGEILTRTQGDTGFNDRFLFVINKSDLHSDRPSKEVHDNFAKYLKNPSKWGLDNSKKELKELADKAKDFSPRIFLTAASISYATQHNIPSLSPSDLKKNKTLIPLHTSFENFHKQITIYDDESFHLNDYCDLPQYRKDEINQKFKNLITSENSDDTIHAIELQSGICALEMAVQDYIERYAYPIKVRDLLKTFEDILGDVHSFTKATVDTIKEMTQSINDKTDKRKEQERQRLEIEEKIQALDEAKKSIQEQLNTLEAIQFDDKSLQYAIDKYDHTINKDPEIIRIRANPMINTGKKTHSQVEIEIRSLYEHLSRLFTDGILDLNENLEAIQGTYEQQLAQIGKVYQQIINDLKDKGILTVGNFDFTTSILWRKSFTSIDTNGFVDELKKSIVDTTTVRKTVWNSDKGYYRYSGNFIKVIGSFFMPQNIKKTITTNGSYDVRPILKAIPEYFIQLKEERDEIIESYTSSLKAAKEKITDDLTALTNGLRDYQQDIQTIISKISNDQLSIESDNQSLLMLNAQLDRLNSLILNLKGEHNV